MLANRLYSVLWKQMILLRPKERSTRLRNMTWNSSQNPASGCSILGLWTTCLGGEDRWGFRS